MNKKNANSLGWNIERVFYASLYYNMSFFEDINVRPRFQSWLQILKQHFWSIVGAETKSGDSIERRSLYVL